MRAVLALSLTLIACGGGVDPSLDPTSLWILPPAPSAPALPDGVRVRAVTLNLHGGQDAPASSVVAALAPLSLDLVALEECPEAYADAVSAAIELPHRVGREGNVLLSKTPLTSTRSVSLVNGRGFVAGRTVIDGAPISVYAAHIGWNHEGDLQCRELVTEHVQPDPEPRVLLMGDFNDEHLSSQASELEVELEDAFTALGWYPGQRISWPATGFDGSEGSQLIDLFYYRKRFAPIVLAGDVLNLSPVVSDHKPSFVELLYPKGDRPFEVDPFPGRREPWAVVTVDPAKNLLTNPGAEDGARGWTAEGGEIAEGERENQPPHGGSKHFTGASLGEAVISGWSQEVALDAPAIDEGRGWIELAGWMATGYRMDAQEGVRSNVPKPYDEGEVILELLDGAGALLDRHTTGRRDTLRYHPFGARIAAPIGARKARVRLLSHRKDASGSSSDAVFDDLYLALASGEAHGRAGELARVDGEGAGGFGEWTRVADGEQLGIMVYPSRTRSGAGAFAAGPPVGPAMRVSAEGRVEREVGEGALRFGGWSRTVDGRASIELALELYEEDATAPWARYALEPVRAAEWTAREGAVRVPEGIARAALVARADCADDPALVDELTLRVEPR